jgi:hypothetical protein
MISHRKIETRISLVFIVVNSHLVFSENSIYLEQYKVKLAAYMHNNTMIATKII